MGASGKCLKSIVGVKKPEKDDQEKVSGNKNKKWKLWRSSSGDLSTGWKSSKPARNDIIGIDLGTTNSCVSVMEGKKGARTTPLVVAFNQKGNFVGTPRQAVDLNKPHKHSLGTKRRLAKV
ncbi:hypothetical protein IFM89_010937 [Coptis chinensis]|uniref:Heat shock protein 70 n=1 Tax=Coptis chinensis TaxID=261450 RepID=A0A835IPA9_9MAGN|nr:hypothetical protein IFM89_010937 [Coptis chinensis]